MLKFVSLLLGMVLLMSFSGSKDLSFNTTINQISKYNGIVHPQKLFLHLDRPVYFAGDDLWFQSYLVNAADLLVNDYERILYVELVNPQGGVVTKRMFKLSGGKCNGSFSLPENLSPGRYLVIAYTNWMRNMGNDFFFNQEITILEAQRNEDTPSSTRSTANINQWAVENLSDSLFKEEKPMLKSSQLQLSFWPEGGDLIVGLPSRIAFEGVNQYGKPLLFNGVVMDGNQQACARISPYVDGKGFFFLKPQKGKKYHAIVRDAEGKECVFDLPVAKSSGYRLGMQNRRGIDSIDVFINGGTGIPNLANVTLLGMQENQVVKAWKVNLENRELSFRISKNNFRTGVACFTLFDGNRIPQCERLVFINHRDQLNISIKGISDVIGKREHVALELQVKDKSGKPVQGEFSLAVTDANMIEERAYTAKSLVNHMYLSSVLPGRVHNLPFYLQDNKRAHEGMDLLMLVNGWRRFKWQEVLKDSLTSPKYALERGIYIDGQLRRPNNRKTAPKGVEVSMMLMGDRLNLYKAKTNDQGKFSFNIKDFNDTVEVVVQTVNRLKNKANFSIDLTSNLRSDAKDFFSRQKMLSQDRSLSHLFTDSPDTAQTLLAYKGGMKEQRQRDVQGGFFQDTTDILLGDINIKGKKNKNPREQMTSQYGAAALIIGQKQLEDLINDNPWQYGLTSLLYDAFPGLRISEMVNPHYVRNSYRSNPLGESDSLSVYGDSGYDFGNVMGEKTVQFTLTRRSPHRFFIFVDGDLVGMTSCAGKLNSMKEGLKVDDFISMDPSVVKSLELIFSPRESPMFELYSNNFLDMELSASKEAILSIYTKTGAGIFARNHNKGVTNFHLFGFERTREFYSPCYDGTDDLKYVNDHRTTLHWAPVVTTNSQGIGKVEFYNSDCAKSFRVDVAGLSDGGVPGAALVLAGEPLLKTDSKRIKDLSLSDSPRAVKYQQIETETAATPSASHLKSGRVFYNEKPAAYADISVKGKAWGTQSNSLGDFVIDKKKVSDYDTVVVSFGGKAQKIFFLKQLDSNGSKVQLTATDTEKDKPVDAKKLVHQMLQKKRQTSPTYAHFIKGVYRESIKRGNELYGLSDFGFFQKKEGYYGGSEVHATMPLAGRVFRAEDYAMKIKYTPLNTLDDLVPVLDPLSQGLSFLSKDYEEAYDFTLLGSVKFQGRRVYRIGFDQKEDVKRPFKTGEMLIDQVTKGLVHVKWRMSNQGKKYEVPQMYLMSGKGIDQFESIYENNEASYQLLNGKWFLKSALQEVTLKVNGSLLGINREMIVTDLLEDKPEGFKQRLPLKMEKRQMLIKDVSYRPGFWREAWVLPSDSYIEKNIKYLHDITFYK